MGTPWVCNAHGGGGNVISIAALATPGEALGLQPLATATPEGQSRMLMSVISRLWCVKTARPRLAPSSELIDCRMDGGVDIALGQTKTFLEALGLQEGYGPRLNRRNGQTLVRRKSRAR
jgi:hypothetical protein